MVLRLNGLKLGEGIVRAGINNMDFYTKSLQIGAHNSLYLNDTDNEIIKRISPDYYKQNFPTYEQYRENDKKIIEIIKLSGADKAKTDGERVKN